MRKWSMSRVAIWLAMGLAMVVVIALAANAFMAWQTERRLQAELAAIRPAGDPASIGELAPTSIRDEENAAVVLKQLAPRLDAFSKDNAPVYATKDIGVIRAILEKYPDISAGLAAAADREKYASTTNFNLQHARFVNDSLTNQAADIHTTARFLDWQVAVLLAAGKHEEAVERGMDLLRLARLYDAEPLLVNYLVGVAVRGIAVNMLYDALAAGPVRPELHAALDKELALHDTPQRIVHALKTDRAYSASVAEAGAGPTATNMPPLLVSFLGWPMKRHFIASLDYLGEQIALVEKSWPNVNKRVGRGSAPGKEELGTMAALMVPGLQAAYDAEARIVATMRALRIFNALRQFAEKNGREAAGLEELALPQQATIDPYSGAALKLKRTDDGWVVYSVFRNGVDDGGEFKEMKDFGVAPRGVREAD